MTHISHATARQRGELLALTLYLKRNPSEPDTYLTAYGTYTTFELYALIRNLVLYGDHVPPRKESR